MKYTITTYSGLANKYNSSSDFSTKLLFDIKDVMAIKLISGTIPYTTNRCLYYDLDIAMTKNVYTPMGKPVCGVLRWGSPRNVGDYIFIEKETLLKTKKQYIKDIGIKIYDIDDNIMSFGTDLIYITSMTNVADTIIQTSTNHGLVLGDEIYINGVDNMSNRGLNNMINSKYSVTLVVSPTTFKIGVDLSSQSASQPRTGTEGAYTFGGHVTVKMSTGETHSVNSVVAYGVTGTEIETNNPHGLISGSVVRIEGMDNGLISYDNQLVNGLYTITTITSTTKFVIYKVLSGYPATAYKTNSYITYLLGSNGHIRIKKYQVSLDFDILCTGIKQYKQARLTHPGIDSIRDINAYYKK